MAKGKTQSFEFNVDQAQVVVTALHNYIDPVMDDAAKVDIMIGVMRELNEWVRTIDPSKAMDDYRRKP